MEIPDSVISSSNGSGAWVLNNQVATSGIYCDSATILNVGDSIVLTTIPFSTVGYDSIFLYFNHICKIEFFDDGYIEVSTDSGLTWNQLIGDMGGPNNNCIYHGYSNFSAQGSRFQEASYANWFPGMVSDPDNSWWKREIFDISSVLNNIPFAQIRFILKDRNNNGGAGRSGWFLDDIFIDSTLNTNLYTFMNRIEGQVYVDLNSNQIRDAAEPPVNFSSIHELNSPNWTFTYSNGKYLLPTYTTGSLTVQLDSNLINNPYFNAVPSSHSVTFTGIGQMDSLNDFALQPTVTVNDLSINVYPYGNCFGGNHVSYLIHYFNKGTTTLNPTIVFNHNSIFTYYNSSPTPSNISSDSIVWLPGPIYPLQRGYIYLHLQTAPTLPINTPVIIQARIEPISADFEVTDNYSYDTTYVCPFPFDPNLITVNKQSLTPSEIAVPEYLEYTIYFQNTGADTATYVRIDNEIPYELDINTFELLSYSHDVELQYNYFINPRLISFTYENIMLPDSNVNEPGSHGFVKYRIKPLNSLLVGDSILNSAEIYFDFNAPVPTNTVTTTIIDPLSINEGQVKNDQLKVFPNPVNNQITIQFYCNQPDAVSIDLFNIFGQHIKSVSIESLNNGEHQQTIDVSDLSNGIYLVRFGNGSASSTSKFVKIGESEISK